MKKMFVFLGLLFIPFFAYASDYSELVAGAVNFETGQSKISQEQQDVVVGLTQRLQNAEKVILIGHADRRGNRLYNLELADRRASAVKDLLAKLGVKSNVTMTVSYGEERPLAPNDNTPGHLAVNRSVEIVVLEVPKPHKMKNRVFLIGGGGPHTLNQKNRGAYVDVDWEYQPVFGLGYQRLLTDRISLGILGLSNTTFGLTIGYDF